MAISAGSHLGPYEILSPLGAGGMGEVYKARDKKLDRDVAVKVLPQSVAADPDTLARFEREAKAVAALSHPNILSIHDFGNHDGVAYAVMELLEGETLRGKLDAGPITQKQVVDYALQVAKGLSAAHDKGIVHRDLKPENLFVSGDGHVKILDFGLAKRVDPVAPGKETSAPTGSGHTEPGTVMGTAGYMSPEQVKGFPVDHRSDIFAFGTILYELLSGKKAFKRDTNAETMAAIMRDEPPELSESGRNISAALDRIVKHCLEKNREHRFQSARDIAFNLSEQSSPAATSGSRDTAPPIPSEGLRIAVLPFKCGDANADLAALADGLSEEIVTGLSRFRYLSVVSSASAALLTGEAGDERALGKKLGARYVLEGSIRERGSAVRVSAQLVDTQTGAQLWSETFSRDLQALSLFAVQDDVAARIVATVADSDGVLVRSMRLAIQQKDDVHLTPAEWQFQYFAYCEQITPAAHAALRTRLERAMERDNRTSDVWACLAQIYADEYAFGFGTDPAALDRALAAARRAMELDRASQFALVSLARVHFFRRDLAAFGPAAERAMALNPLNTDALGMMGLQIVHTGQFERGAAIVRRAMELNANHAGWMHFAPLWEHFHKGEYEGALERANRVDIPGFFWTYLAVASACGHLGRRAEAASAVRDLLALDPEFAAHARSNVATWHFASGLMEPILDGLRKAGLSIPATDGSSDSPGRIGTVTARADQTEPGTASGPVRADEGFWVAVLPFKYGGANAELAALAEGMTEDIVTGLSRFSYLRVIARSSTSRYANEAVDVRAAGKELGARYVMEGTLRKAGQKLRLAVQLVDAASGAHLWAQTYERAFDPEAAFELQDDVVPRIVSTCADRFGVLARSISDAVRGREPGQLGPYEALMRGFGYHQRLTPAEHADARRALERAVDRAPSNADCWAMLSWIYSHEHAHGFNVGPGSLDRALAAARRAVDIAPSNQLAQQALAVVLFFRKETAGCLSAAERAIALNPLDTSNEAIFLIPFTGDWDRGCALIRRAMELNPHHPRWYGTVLGINEYRLANYRAVVDEVVKANAPEVFWTNVLLAAAHAQLGELPAARNALRDLLAQKEDFAQSAVEMLEKWFDPQLVGHLIEGLRTAGLEVAPEKRAGSPALESSKSPAPNSGAVRAEEGFWVAVLPFKYGGANRDLMALAEGLTEEIVTGLSRFSYLRVIARSSTSRYASESVDVRSAGKELGARYVMEGSLREAGTRLRLAVQLVDAGSGAHLWAENFERAFSPETVFELQDDLVPRIVSTVADMYGVLTRSMSEALRGRADEELSPHEAVLSAFGYMERVTPEEHARVRKILERTVSMAPNQSDAWAMLANLYWEEHAHGLNPQPDPLGRALAAARRAVEAAPSNNLAHYALASTLFFQKDFLAFRSAAERAIELNRMDASVAALIGNLIAYSGDWEHGCAVVQSAMQLNPRHPGWYWFVHFNDAYRRRDYRGALGFALKINLPGNFYTHAVIAQTYGQLGMREEARKALQELLAMRPDFARTAREEYGRWFPDLAFIEHQLDGLRKAGLEIAPEKSGAVPAPGNASFTETKPESETARADEEFRVAVLPFKYSGPGNELAALAEGLTEDVVTGLSRFSYLRVIARSSTAHLANQAVDIRAAGKELGARYVIEGSLRQGGTKLRLSVQLVDASSGAHLWAENYERAFSPETVFELQDDLAPRIVSTVADMNGVLPRSMSEAVRSRDPEQLNPYEAVLRSFGYLQRITPEDLAAARSGLESAVRKAPAYADAWAMLAFLCGQEYGQGFKLQADPLTGGAAAARRAVESDPSNALAYFSLAQALFFQKDFQSFRNAAERAVALNPMDGNSMAFLGEMLTYAGDEERGLALAGRAKQLNPNHPGWYWYADFFNAYRHGDYRRALGFVLKANLPGHWGMHAAVAAAYGQLGERDAAAKALRDLLKLRPDFAAEVRTEFEKWWEPAFVESLLDGLRKAGLEIPDERNPTASAGVAAVAIAVLPFADLSPEKNQAYLCEGMAEEIMNALVRIDGIRVASRTSAFRARQGGGDLAAIARSLSVGNVLEGSVRTAGGRLRVTAQLTDVASGYQLWSERFDRDTADVFAVQDEIAAGVVEAVKARLAPGSRTVQHRAQVRNLDAYRSYLKGRHLRGKEDFGGALSAFEEAVRLDPAHAPSWTGLAEITILSAHMGMIPPRAACTAARKALAAAKELQGESAEGQHVEAFAAFLERRWDAMESAWRRAIEIQPDHVLALGSFALTLCARRRLDEALPLFERAREADPLASFPYMIAGWGLLESGRPEEALRHIEDALTFEKEDGSAIGGLAMANVALGRFEEGIASGEHGVAVAHRAPVFLGILGWALATAGRYAEARTILEELRARPPGSPTAVSEAWLLGALGEIDGAFEVLARAEEEHQGVLCYTGLPGFDSLRADPRFAALLGRLGLPSA
ncbi:MAG: protein kinase [Acidobacteriota bacterium]|nr:protein kinase [Acidobacteriota bacterium]